MKITRYRESSEPGTFTTEHSPYRVAPESPNTAVRYAVRIASKETREGSAVMPAVAVADAPSDETKAQSPDIITAGRLVHERFLLVSNALSDRRGMSTDSAMSARAMYNADPFGNFHYDTHAYMHYVNHFSELPTTAKTRIVMRSATYQRLATLMRIQILAGAARSENTDLAKSEWIHSSHEDHVAYCSDIEHLRFDKRLTPQLVGAVYSADSDRERYLASISVHQILFRSTNEEALLEISKYIKNHPERPEAADLCAASHSVAKHLNEYIKAVKCVERRPSDIIAAYAQAGVTKHSVALELALFTEERLACKFKIDRHFYALRASVDRRDALEQARRAAAKKEIEAANILAAERAEALRRAMIKPAWLAKESRDFAIPVVSLGESSPAYESAPSFLRPSLDFRHGRIKAARADEIAFAKRSQACASNGHETPYTGRLMYHADPLASFLPPLDENTELRDDLQRRWAERYFEPHHPYHERQDAILAVQIAAARVRSAMWRAMHSADTWSDHAAALRASLLAHQADASLVLTPAQTRLLADGAHDLVTEKATLARAFEGFLHADDEFGALVNTRKLSVHVAKELTAVLEASRTSIKTYVRRLREAPLPVGADLGAHYREHGISAASQHAEFALISERRTMRYESIDPKLAAAKHKAAQSTANGRTFYAAKFAQIVAQTRESAAPAAGLRSATAFLQEHPGLSAAAAGAGVAVLQRERLGAWLADLLSEDTNTKALELLATAAKSGMYYSAVGSWYTVKAAAALIWKFL